MPNRNIMTAIGHLGADPTLRFLPNGNALCNITVACTDKWKGKDGEWKEATEWVKASIFGDVAELVGELFKKGDAIHLEGKQVTRKYKDKEGNERYSTELNASYVAKPVYSKKKVEKPDKPATPSYNDMPDSDIPFLFNMNTVCDTMGTSKSLIRAKHGKVLSLVWANKGNF